MVHEITSYKEFQELISCDGKCVVDLGAQWCGPCKAIAPKFQGLSELWTNIKFYKVDIDLVPEVPNKFEIVGVPTFLFFHDGVLREKFAGASFSRLGEEIERLDNDEYSEESKESE